MVPWTEILFSTVVAFLLVHELDAIRQHEWRFFFVPVTVRDESASRIFTALHAPLFAVILVYANSPAFQIGFDGFAIVHGLLHLGLRNHPLLEFDDWFSRVWIFGASLLGFLHLLFIL
jgi:hypothetical protein